MAWVRPLAPLLYPSLAYALYALAGMLSILLAVRHFLYDGAPFGLPAVTLIFLSHAAGRALRRVRASVERSNRESSHESN